MGKQLHGMKIYTKFSNMNKSHLVPATYTEPMIKYCNTTYLGIYI